jgi:hypothetical protein
MAVYNVGVEESASPADTVVAEVVAPSTAAEAAPVYQPIQNVIPSYLYVQYNDDEDLQAFVATYNDFTQGYLNWFNTLNLPIYTYGSISGALLDWVGAGLYGLPRPGLPTSGTPALGPFNTYPLNGLAFNTQIPEVNQTYYATTDDTYKRILTWLFYKGDGRVFNVRWLKRRVARFLAGINGAAPDVANTYDISVEFTGPAAVTITVPASADATIFIAAVNGGILELPFQITWTVTT